MLHDTKKLPDNVFPLVWGLVIRQGKEKPLCVGACTKTWKPFFIGNILHAIAYQDCGINQESGECQFGTRCLNLECEFNKTTFESYFRAGTLAADKRKRLEAKWSRILAQALTYQSVVKACKEAYAKNPIVRVIQIGQFQEEGVKVE